MFLVQDSCRVFDGVNGFMSFDGLIILKCFGFYYLSGNNYGILINIYF